MCEKELMRKAKEYISFMQDVIDNYLDYDEDNIQAYEDRDLVQGLLDLYTKEKEKNKELINKQLDFWFWLDDEEKKTTIKNMYINKDKIREKIETTKKDCEKCRFKESGICEELNKNNQCTQGTILKVLKELMEG